ncbi:hypothetical protein MNBD_NITROSPINAE03-552, partial [hydrothermal vent metagenome]
MIIKCPQCSSSYKIDGSALPHEGTYAKCSTCGNLFFVRKRSEEEIDLIKKNKAKRGKPPTGDKTPEASAASEINAPEKAENQSASVEKDEAVDLDDIDNLIAAHLPTSSDTTPRNEEDSSEKVDSDNNDIDTLIAANLPEPGDQAKTEPPAEEPAEAEPDGQDDIDALLAANAPAKAEEPAEEDTEEFDIDDLLAANAPAKAEEPAEPDGQDDIDALLAANAPAKAEEPAEPDGQDDIDALLAANAPAKVEEPEPAEPDGQD